MYYYLLSKIQKNMNNFTFSKFTAINEAVKLQVPKYLLWMTLNKYIKAVQKNVPRQQLILYI